MRPPENRTRKHRPRFLTTAFDQDCPGGIARCSSRQISNQFPESNNLKDSELKEYWIKASLSRTVSLHEENDLRFSSTDGDSFIKLNGRGKGWSSETDILEFKLIPNEMNRLSLITTKLQAYNAWHAHALFMTNVNIILSYFSFELNVPVFIDRFITLEPESNIETFFFTTPYKDVDFDPTMPGPVSLLSPIYSIYREAKNSFSSAYQLFCFARIMEGIYKSVQPKVARERKLKGPKTWNNKVLIPSHPFIHSSLEKYCGKSVKYFYDEEIRKSKIRDLLAHFTLNSGEFLDIDMQLNKSEIGSLAFLSDLAVRELISDLRDQCMECI